MSRHWIAQLLAYPTVFFSIFLFRKVCIQAGYSGLSACVFDRRQTANSNNPANNASTGSRTKSRYPISADTTRPPDTTARPGIEQHKAAITDPAIPVFRILSCFEFILNIHVDQGYHTRGEFNESIVWLIMENIKSFESDRGNPLTDVLADWLVEQALRDTPIEEIFQSTCRQIHASGIPLARAHVTFKVLHPLFRAQSITWELDQKEVKFANYLYGGSMEPWFQSPLYHMVANKLPFLRRRLSGENAMLDFPMLEDLAEQGITDYLGFLIQFGEDMHDPDSSMELEQASGVVGSWATDRASGFTNSDLRSLKRIEQRLAVAFKINIQSRITRNILTAYLGPSVGDKVLSGQITRGDVETINSVIWYCDMRESTKLADSTSAEEFLQILNSYFESTAGAVVQHGGEVLSFIGDAVLAIFPIGADGDARSACNSALNAATTAQSNLDIVNQIRIQQSKPDLKFGTALHVGELLFGNIGIPERVDFSVIGSVANEVARLESLTKTLNQPILVSDAFAQNLDLEWIPAGNQSLRGVDQTVAVYAPPKSSIPL